MVRKILIKPERKIVGVLWRWILEDFLDGPDGYCIRLQNLRRRKSVRGRAVTGNEALRRPRTVFSSNQYLYQFKLSKDQSSFCSVVRSVRRSAAAIANVAYESASTLSETFLMQAVSPRASGRVFRFEGTIASHSGADVE